MRKLITTSALGIVLALFAGAAAAEDVQLAVNEWPETQQAVVVDSASVDGYRDLAARIGLDYDREYGYTEWADTNRQHEIGVAGEYEPLACSVSDDPWSCFSDANGYWQSMYYSNHDVTVLYRVRNGPSNTYSYVKLLKLERGRVPDIHRR